LQLENESLASFGSRIGAYLIDYVLLSVVGFAGVSGASALIHAGEEAVGGVLMAIVLTGAILVIPGLWAGGLLGASPGKRMVKIAVVGFDGRPIGAGRGLLRQFVLLLGAAVFYIGWLAALWSPRRQAWHDAAAKSLVVQESAVVLPIPERLPDGELASGPSCPVCGFPLGPDGRCSVCGATAA
jgi:uncharacterized RDD family membrane protein YckC